MSKFLNKIFKVLKMNNRYIKDMASFIFVVAIVNIIVIIILKVI